MRWRLRTYTAYSVACFVVWGIIFGVGAATGHHRAGYPVVLVFAGWVLGWLSATIARVVYPPPRPRGRPSAPAA